MSGDELFTPASRARIVTVGKIEQKPYDDSPDAVASRLLEKPVVIHLFTDGPDKIFASNELTSYLQGILGPNFTIENHGDLVQYSLSHNPDKREQILSKLAAARYFREGYLREPQKLKLEEEIATRDPSVTFREFAGSQKVDGRGGFGYYYESNALDNAFRFMIPKEMMEKGEKGKNVAIVVTGRGIGERDGIGIHMRAGNSLMSLSVVSTTGLVEAPGKPVELERAYHTQLGYPPHFDNQEYNDAIWEAIRKNGNVLDHAIVEDVIRKIFGDRMIYHGDIRINEAVKGMSLSMILFTLGEHGRVSQCSTSDLSSGKPDTTRFCRLHDAHWQEELISTQVKAKDKPEFCDYHTEVFRKLKLS